MPAPVSGSGTSETSLQVSWTGLSSPQDGDSAVTSYNLQWDNGTAGLVYYDLVGVAPYTTVLSYTVTTGVVPSQTYRFQVRARNIYGWGPFS